MEIFLLTLTQFRHRNCKIVLEERFSDSRNVRGTGVLRFVRYLVYRAIEIFDNEHTARKPRAI